jgi:cytochrome d ubiquinol oxidase subunit II
MIQTLLNNPWVIDGLPLVFAGLMGIAILVYVVLDGYDLGVGILFPLAKKGEQDVMIGSIGPFWDANETWLVLAVGLLLVAFPIAHGVILTALYIPVAVMLLGLIMRGVAFEFRAKVYEPNKKYWNAAFAGGSILASLAQGYMLGMYIMGLEENMVSWVFSSVIALCLTAAYALVGACWLIMKTETALQQRAIKWAREALIFTALGMVAISLISPLASPRIFEKWFALPQLLLLAPLPIMAGAVFVGVAWVLKQLPAPQDKFCWAPFAGVIGIFMLGFTGLAYSFFPYVVPDQLTIWQAAAATESLAIMLVGALLVLPVMIGYTWFIYKIFHGKATHLRYD